ncbi:MAG: hypothetical protein CMO01_17445 [Thalassobius sp.]|nr:hypothetical protein [Thalassovita sp.]
MIKREIILLLSVLLTSCLSNYHYRKKLYSDQVVDKRFNKNAGFPKDQAFNKHYLILEKVFVRGTNYEVLITNWSMYYYLKDCNIISDFNEYEKFMLKHHKKGIALDSICFSKLMFYSIDLEFCEGMDINPYDYINEDGYLKEGINNRDSIDCILRSLLLSENLFIESYHGDLQVKRKQKMDDMP